MLFELVQDKELDKGDPTPRVLHPYPDPTGDREEDIQDVIL
jgi:hypothetical protein